MKYRYEIRVWDDGKKLFYKTRSKLHDSAIRRARRIAFRGENGWRIRVWDCIYKRYIRTFNRIAGVVTEIY